VVAVEHVDELDETPLGVGNVTGGEQPARVVDDRHRERVFVGVYSGDHACHLPFDVTAGSATRQHSGAVILSCRHWPSLYRATSPTITATGRQPLSRASPTLAGSIRLSRRGPPHVAGASRAFQSALGVIGCALRDAALVDENWGGTWECREVEEVRVTTAVLSG
jgi:hypothetical protein